jgi:hypothetical protein
VSEASEQVVLRGHVRQRSWERLSRGLYVKAVPRTLAQTLRAWQQVLPATAAFAHLTAAELRGWWLPSPIPHPIFVAALHQLSRPRRPGLLVCRHPKPFGVDLLDGIG